MDPDVISLNPPLLSEPCLHSGTNLLKSTDLTDQWTNDTYSRDFKLVMSSLNGFRKEFPLKKNIGLGGWELNITPEDLAAIPKINMSLETELVGMRGFNEIRSPKFNLPLPLGGNWEITNESQKAFAVGGKRTITLRNSSGSCRCLQRVIYKPSFGGQFVYEAGSISSSSNGLQYSADAREVSFEIDTTNFQPGAGTWEVKTYGGEANQFNQPNQQFQMNQQSSPQQPSNGNNNNLNLKLYPAPPAITQLQARRGDRKILITGERLEQLQAITINGKRAILKSFQSSQSSQSLPDSPRYSNQPNSGNSVNPVNSENSANLISQYRNIAPNQRIAVFEDSGMRINTDNLSLELNLEDNRTFSYPNEISSWHIAPGSQS